MVQEKFFPLKSTVSDENGFTLIEVLIALGIFAIGILGISSMQIYSVQGNSNAWEFTESTHFASDNLESLMRLDYDDPGLVNGTATQGKYTISWTITDNDPVPNVRKITMNVTWVEKGQNRTFTADYYKAVTI